MHAIIISCKGVFVKFLHQLFTKKSSYFITFFDLYRATPLSSFFRQNSVFFAVDVNNIYNMFT